MTTDALMANNWDFAKPLIAAALEQSPGFETIVDVERKLVGGEYDFWATDKSAIITAVVQYPRKKVLNVVHGGGDLAEIVSMEPQLTARARDMGCNGILIEGRKGWQRALASEGYRFAYLALFKEIA